MAIYITNGHAKFWVKDNKKIKFYKKLAITPNSSITILKEK